MVYLSTDKSEREASCKRNPPASILTDAQLHAELEKGFTDLAAGRTRPAAQAFEDIHRDYEGTSDKTQILLDAYPKWADAENQVQEGMVLDAEESLILLRKKYDV